VSRARPGLFSAPLLVALTASLTASCGLRGEAEVDDKLEEVVEAPQAESTRPEGPHKTRTGKVGKTSKAGKSPPNIGPASRAQQTVLAFNNAASLARVGDTLLTLYRDSGDVKLARSAPAAEGAEASPEATTTTTATTVTVASGNASGVALAVDGQDVLVLFIRGNSLNAALSDDGGLSFGTAWPIVSGAGRPQGPSVRLWRSEAGLRAVLTYHLGNQITGQLYTSTLMDGTWSAPARLDGDGEGSWATLEGDGDRTIAVWKDFRHREREPTLYLAELADPTGPWSAPRSLGMVGADPSLCLDSGGRMHMVYQQNFRQLRYVRSDDRGQTWSAPTSVEEAPGLFGRVTCHPSNPAELAVTWEKFIGDGSNKDDHVKVVGLARSRDRGDTFEVIPVLDNMTSQIRSSALLTGDGALEVSWIDLRGEPTVKWQTY